MITSVEVQSSDALNRALATEAPLRIVVLPTTGHLDPIVSDPIPTRHTIEIRSVAPVTLTTARSAAPTIVVEVGGPRILAHDESSPIILVLGIAEPRVCAFHHSRPRVEAFDHSAPEISVYGHARPTIIARGFSDPKVHWLGTGEDRDPVTVIDERFGHV